MYERGKIRNPKNISRLRDFSGLRYGLITPTDIDAFFEFGNKSFIFMETKRKGAKMPKGQRLALERLCDACDSPKHRAVVFIAEHGDEEIIDFAKLQIIEIRFGGKWIPIDYEINLRAGINLFRATCER
jgi:hypothetical protein